MAYNVFGGSPADVATTATGDVAPGATFSVYTSPSGGVRITDLRDVAGNVLPGIVTSDASGRIRFEAPDSYSVVYLETSAGARWAVAAQSALGRLGEAITKADAASLAADAAAEAADVAATSAQAATSRSEDALEAATSAANAAAEARAAAGSTAPAVTDLPRPIFIAHRGGANVFPEGALETYRAAADLPDVGMMEADVHLLADGSTIVMHDSTLDRTTTLSGPTAKMTAGAVQRARIDAGAWFGSTWPNDLRVPTFDDFLDVVGHRRAIAPQAGNTGSGAAIVERVLARGLASSTLLQSFALEELDAGIAAGIETGYLHATGAGVDWAALAARGVRWALLQDSAPESAFTAAAAAGLLLGAWTVDRHVDRDRLLALGVEAIFSDDPWYMAETHRLTSDPFAAQTYPHGHLAAVKTGLTAPRGTFSSSGWELDVATETAFFQSVLQGWASPVKGNAAADAFTLDFKMTHLEVEAAGNWGSVFIGATDAPYDDALAPASRPPGWHVLFRSTGVLDVYKVSGGTSTSVGTVTTSSAPTLGTARDYRIVVTPAAITVSAPGIGTPNSVTVNDASLRGGYLHFGASNARVRFSNVTVS